MTNRPAPGWWMIPGAILGLALYGCAASVILADRGGLLRDYAARVEAGPPASIQGHCASACTMWLSNGCVYPDATLTFHGAVYPSGDQMPPDRQDYWDGYMAAHYPKPLADWFMTTGRHGSHTLTGAQVIDMGAQPCIGD